MHLGGGQAPSQEEVDDIVAQVLAKFPPKSQH
jgi:hypothetical protein